MDFDTELVARLEDGRSLVRVLCELSPAEDGTPPSLLHIMPFGPILQPNDGRGAFQVSNPLGVIARSRLPMLIDWEHRSEWGDTRAAGWLETLELAEDVSKYPQPGTWGRARWTAQGATDVTSLAFRFLSPVLLIDDAREVHEIASVALTNRPALTMHGIESFRERLSARFGPLARSSARGGTRMDAATRRALCSAYGLQAEADDATIITRANALTAELSQQREACARLTTDLNNANQQLAEAQTRIEEQERVAFTAEVDALLKQGSEEGRLTPAMLPNWREFCSQSRSNLEMFRDKLLPSMPKLGPSQRAPQSKAPEKKDQPASRADKKLAAQGFSQDEIAAAEKYNREVLAVAGDDDEED